MAGPYAVSQDDAGLDASAARDVVASEDSCHGSAAGSAWAAWPVPDPGAPSYDTSTPDVVIDRVTGLVWERSVSTESYAWEQATARCECLTLANRDDWHLPTRIELVSIVDFTKTDPAVDGDAFPATPSDYFWTSSLAAGNDGAAWYLYFLDGNAHTTAKDTTYRVRCVRSDSSAAAPSFTSPGDGTVVDRATKLAWQRDVDPTERTWSDANAYCETLAIAGGGFRLPNMKELQTLVDETRVDPAVDVSAFPATPSESFWTASPLAGSDTEAWFVDFYNGVAYSSLVGRMFRVRCVR